MAQSIDDFIQGFQGGTRTNRFIVEGSIGDANSNYGNFTAFHIRATNLPSAKMGIIPISYRGRVVNYPGDRTYDPWQIVVLDDTDSTNLYDSFHNWHNSINNHSTNISNGNIGTVDGYVNFGNDFTVTHLDVNGGQASGRKFTLKNAWPIEVGPIALDIGQMDTLVTFAVTFVHTGYEVI
jgi:hypothetical protein